MSVTRLVRSALALMFCLGAATNAALAAGSPLSLDDEVEDVRGWSVGYSRALGGCIATAKFDDQTSVWIGFGNKLGSFIAFTNVNWRSLQVEQPYSLEINAGGYGRWTGSFVAFNRDDEKGLINAGLKTNFILDLARAESMAISFGGRKVTQVSLNGSRAALEHALECQKRNSERSAQVPRDPGPSASERRKGGSSGTGFFVSKNGHVLTNNHVVEGCSTFEVNRVGALGEKAQVLATDAKNDLALLKTGLVPAVVPGFRMRVRVGENISVFGFPLSTLLASTGNYTVGNVTAVAGLGDDTRMLQISAPVQPGNSGGPLIDASGNIAGVIVSKLNALSVAQVTKDLPQNVNFAIKSTIAANFLESNGISPRDVAESKALEGADLAERAKQFTVRIVCR